MPADTVVTLPDLLALLRERRVPAAICAGVAVLLVLFVGLWGPNQYRAEARLAIERGRLEVPFATNPAFEGDDLVLVYTQSDLLLSTTVLGKALASGALRGSAAYDLSDDPIAALRRRLSVIANRDSRVLVVQLADEDPRRAEHGLRAVVDAFLAAQAQRDSERSQRSVEFLSRQVAEAGLAADKARDEEQKFRIANNLFQGDAERSFATQRLTTLQGRLVVMREQVASLDTLLGRLDADLKNPDPRALLATEAVARNPVVLEVTKQLIDQENRRDALAERYLTKHPQMISLERQVVSKREQLAQAASQVVRGLHAERDKLVSQLTSLDAHIRKEEQELQRYQQGLVQLETFTERTKSRSSLYAQLLKRLGEETVASRLDRSEAVLADPPRAAPRPVSWTFTGLLPIALLAGVVVGCAGGLAFHVLDTRVRGSAGLGRATGLAVLGHLRQRRRGDPPPTDEALAPARQLREVVALRAPEGSSHVWLMAGCEPASGADAVALQLATAFASAGARTLLVDANLRDPALAAAYGVTVQRGFDLLLAGEPDIAPLATGVANLDLMAPSHAVGNAAELLHSHCLPEWLGHIRPHYDHVVIVTSALSTTSDALVIAAHADMIIVTAVEGGLLQRIRAAVAQLSPLAARVAGAVLTTPVPAGEKP